jgi:hypothetical protein
MGWFPPTPYQPGLDEEASIFLQGTLVTTLCHLYTKPLTTFRLPGQRQQQEGATGGRQGLEEAAGLSLLQGPQVPGFDENGSGD